MSKHLLLWLLTALTLASGISAVSANSDAVKKNEEYMAAIKYRVWTQKDWTDWASRNWDKDDQPYRKIQVEINHLIMNRKMTTALLAQYKRAARQTLSDPRIVFRWAYAAERMSLRARKTTEKSSLLDGVAQAMLMAPFPDTYSYARIRFLVQMKSQRFINDLKGAGERLLKRNPKDYDVKYFMTNVYSISPDDGQQKKAYLYAQDLVRLRPKNPNAHAMLGSIHLTHWRKTKSKADADKAIACYRQYLKLAPADAEFRKYAQRTMEMVQREQAKNKA